jgi:hypothetical protein
MNVRNLIKTFTILLLVSDFNAWVIKETYIHNGKRVNCGEANLETRRMTNASETPPFKYPWIAEMYLFRVSYMHCSGSVITDLHILTSGE